MQWNSAVPLLIRRLIQMASYIVWLEWEDGSVRRENADTPHSTRPYRPTIPLYPDRLRCA
jgi:hypothetical protein